MSPRDQDGPWVLDTRELIRRPGAMRTMSHSVVAPTAIGTDVVAIRPGENVGLSLQLESVVEGVLATGEVRSTATAICVRCLDEVEVPVDVTLQELFAYPDRAAHHQQVEQEQEERHELDQDLMDLETAVRDAVVTALPFQPVCRDDCPGLCAQCGARLADDPDHGHELIDPRWSALADLSSTTDNEKRI